MKHMVRLIIGAAILLMYSACAPVIVKPQWNFEKQAVKLNVKADHNLNMYNGTAHTLYICLYQLKGLNSLDQLAQDPAGIRQLLECRLFDDSVAAASSKVIHAGEHITLIMDRAEKARHLAVVAGYSAGLTNERVIKRHPFKAYKHRESYLKRKFRCIPCELDIELSLGPYQIEYSKTLQTENVCSDECD